MSVGCLKYENFILLGAYCFHQKLLEVNPLSRSPTRTEINILQHREHCLSKLFHPKAQKMFVEKEEGSHSKEAFPWSYLDMKKGKSIY